MKPISLPFASVCAFLAVSVCHAANSEESTEGWSGAFEFGSFASNQSSNDTDIDEDPFYGFSFGASAVRDMGDTVMRADFYGEGFDPNDAEGGEESSGTFFAVTGLHYGWQDENSYTGVFAAYGRFDGYSDDDETDHGVIVGVEGAYGGPESMKFAQLGYANIIGDDDDNEFTGPFARAGYSSEVGDGLAWNATVDFGLSIDCFEDCGDDEGGFYLGAGFEVSYDINEQMEIYGAINHRFVEGEDDDDATGEQTNLYVGLRVPFGGGGGPSVPATPRAPFEAANWMEQLD